jgi:hypothetical protein
METSVAPPLVTCRIVGGQPATSSDRIMIH